MILKYTFRLIKSTFNRFVAILAIVFIGVSFMMGMRSNVKIMKDSVERYNDDYNLYDVQVYSNFGFDEEDLKAFKNLDYIDDVFGSKTRDVYAKNNEGTEFVVRIQELESNLNNIKLASGRLPEKENECLAITSYAYGEDAQGQKFDIYLKSEEITEIYKNTSYTIVGTCDAPENMSKNFSSSLLDNKDLTGVLYIPNSNFIFDYYTTVYLTLTGAKDLYSFNDEYKNFVDEKVKLIENFSGSQSQVLKNKIVDDAKAKLDEGIKELEENKAKYEKEISDGKAQLDDAKKQLDAALAQIEAGEKEIPASEQQLIDGQKQIDAGYQELKEKEKELNDGIAQLEQLGMSVDQLDSLASELYSRYTGAKQQRDAYQSQRDDLDNQYKESRNIISASGYRTSLELRYAMARMSRDSEEYRDLVPVLDAFTFVEQQYAGKALQLDSVIATYDATMATVNNTMKATVGMNFDEGYQYLHGAVEQIKDGQRQIRQGYIKLEEAQTQINQGKKQLEAGKIELANGKAEYEKGLVEYNQGVAQYEAGLEEFNHKIQEAQDQIDDGYATIESLGEVEWTVLARYNTNYSYYMYVNTCNQMNSLGNIIPLLFFIVAALVCTTTMTRLIDEQRNQTGIYRALGFRNSEIVAIYMLYVILASFAASLVAVGVGVLMYPTIIYTTWRLLYALPAIKLSMPISDAIICSLSFTVLMMVVTFVVIKQTIQEVPAQLLRPKAPKTTKQILLEKFTWLWKKLNFTTKVTARNIFRYKGRFIMTVLGVAGCTSLLLMGFGIKDSIGNIIPTQFGEISKFDYAIALSNDRHVDEILEKVYADPNTDDALASCQYNNIVKNGFENISLAINVVDLEQMDKIYSLREQRSGKPINLNQDGAYASKKFMSMLDLKVGDDLQIESFNGVKKNIKIVGVVENYINHVVYMSEDYYQKVFNEEVEKTFIGVVNSAGNDINLKKIESYYNDVISVTNISDSIGQVNDMFEALNAIIIVIIIVAGALAFVVLINLTNVNISERIREIATLKVLGFREYEVNSYIFKEVLLMSVIGAIIGLPLGNLEEYMTMNTINMDFVVFPHYIKPISYLYAFVITMIFTVIVLILTRKTLKNVEMVESLKSIE